MSHTTWSIIVQINKFMSKRIRTNGEFREDET